MSIVTGLGRWFLSRQQEEKGPIELHRRGIYILPTKTGMLFASVVALMYVGAVNYNMGLGHALVFLLVGLGLSGMLHTYRNLTGIRIRSGRVEPVFAGESAKFDLLLENRRSEFRPSIRIKKSATGHASFPDHECRIDLAPGDTTQASISLMTEHRGTLALGRLTISTCFPLGLFRAWSYPWPSAYCVVFPAPIFIALPNQGGVRETGNQSVRTEGQDDFAGFRHHHPGDSPRHVAWKIYARESTESPLLVKEFSGLGGGEYWFNWDMPPQGISIEARLSTLCGWILQAKRDNLTFGISIPGYSLPPGRGEHHVARALEALARYGERQ